ncbi:kinesin-like protein Klp61F [Vespa mandarinia]|uniref:kinesin-like protein Klp61F n=1 Tax=Vespa mandarinia TaxID=7446 RepID=UPI00160812C7|nr:kinesin-like protein Klp61F [Vespa mandarinia]
METKSRSLEEHPEKEVLPKSETIYKYRRFYQREGIRLSNIRKMNETRTGKKDKNQHIQVFVRVRPINNAERLGKSVSVVEVPSNKDVIIRERPQDKLSKKFTFDKVFGPLSKQIDVYKAVVSPLLEEVLAGYNCTVFAYGQTGTGKTFTMEGVSNDPALHWQSDTTAGIIPRTLSHLFDELRLLEAQEYTVRISFLELYNEELFDLLSPNDDASKIRLYEDTSRKGAVIIHGLEEVTVHNKSEVYKILEKGSEKRQTAVTLMNAQSSRSHTVFSITVHIKENTVDGEELLKTGKLNLVDLAGSENVGRSGAVDRRAREAGNINQSLLTLGRVITALVERAPHIPYRESKLTRLLQESLGGRTKTSIIATISPASINLEETLSTLDYAHRAKNITNRPEINQKLSKKALLKEYTEEIERLRRDLLATRERNGVYLAQENYNEMQSLIDYQGREIEEKINHIKALEETMQNKEKLFNDLQVEHYVQTNKLQEVENNLASTTNVLKSTKNHLKMTRQERDEQKYLVENHVSTEKILLSQAKTLLNVADTASTDTYKLHDKIGRKTKVEEENENLSQQFQNNIKNRFQDIENDLSVYTHELVQFCMSLKTQIETVTSEGLTAAKLTTKKLAEDIDSSYTVYEEWLKKEIEVVSNVTEDERNRLDEFSRKLVSRIESLVKTKIAENLNVLNESVSQKLQHLATLAKTSINEMCNYQLTECNQLCKNIEEIEQTVQNVLHNQGQTIQENQQFAKMFEDVYLQFNNLRKNENQRHIAVSDMLNHVNKTCDNISNKIKDDYKLSVDKKQSLQDKLENDFTIIENDVAMSTKENRILADQILEQSVTLTEEIQTELSARSNALEKYKNVSEDHAKALKHKTENDRIAFSTLINNINEITETTYANTQVGNKLESRSTESIECNNRIIAQVHTTEHEIEKFLIEDLRHDVATGLTPARKEFQYPRHLTATSPHERILQRFREIRKNINTSESDEDTILNQSSENETIISSPLFENTVISASTPIFNINGELPDKSNTVKYNIVRAASASDISLIPRPTLETSIQSEPDLCIKNHDKENDKDEFLKPDMMKSKRLSKTRCSNRKVLGSYN